MEVEGPIGKFRWPGEHILGGEDAGNFLHWTLSTADG